MPETAPKTRVGCAECGSMTKHRRYCSKATYTAKMPGDTTYPEKSVDLDQYSIKEVEELVGQKAIDVRVENKRVVFVFGLDHGAETRVHIRRT